MNPASAGAVEFEEPDWRERNEEHFRRFRPTLPHELAENEAFEATLIDWRRFHATPTPEGKHRPASAVDGVIVLARLRIFPPRNRPRDGVILEEQHDDHCWLQISGRAWRIVDAADRTLTLDSFGEQKQIDLNRAKWVNYTQAALAAMHAAWPELEK